MHRCTLISVGDELLDGRVIESNTTYITDKLTALGVDVSVRVVVGDDLENLKSTISWAMEISDLIIITGGLGPTEDDITREALAAVLGIPLVKDDRIETWIRAVFEGMGREMPPSNVKQAEILSGATPIMARLGTAPGQWIEHGGKNIILMPGVPREMMDMMAGDVVPMLRERMDPGASKSSHSLHVAAKPESEVAELTQGIISRYAGVRASYRAQPGQIEVRLSTRGDAGAFNEALDRLREELKPWLVAEGEASLEENLGKELRARGLTLAVAESCTGGMVGERLTRLPGSSDYFKGGIVAYSRQAKTELLHISPHIIDVKGAVCEEVAEDMAQKVMEIFSSHLGISVTGLAGPGDGGEKEPVGTVAFGLASRKGAHSWKYRLPGDRNMVRQVAATIILAITYFYVRGEENIHVR
jgi:nicotinamide-nucleotide amidase